MNQLFDSNNLFSIKNNPLEQIFNIANVKNVQSKVSTTSFGIEPINPAVTSLLTGNDCDHAEDDHNNVLIKMITIVCMFKNLHEFLNIHSL